MIGRCCNIVDIIVYQKYRDNKIGVCVALSKTKGETRLRKLKKKEKGLGGRGRPTNTPIDRLQNYEVVASYSSKC